MLWTDIVEPAALTGYARPSLEALEAQRSGSLARWLPNRPIADISARFYLGDSGLVETAQFRAFDAEPEIGSGPQRRRVTIDLAAVSRNEPVTELNQILARSGSVSDEMALNSIEQATDRATRATFDAVELLRGRVLATGRATIDQENFTTDDDFGRDGSLTVNETAKWSDPETDRLAQITEWVNTYVDINGEEPGVLLMGRTVYNAFIAGSQFKTQLLGGATRPPSGSEVNGFVEAAGLPAIVRYDRKVRRANGVKQSVIPENTVLMLPAPVDVNDAEGTELGSTFWGRTLTSTDSNYGLTDSEQPGLVVGVYRNPKPPMIAEVISDAIVLPVMANANLSFAAVVL